MYLFWRFSRNRFSPRYINIATCWGKQHKIRPEGTKKETRENKANIGGSTKNRDDAPPLRPPKISHHAPSTQNRAAYQTTPSRRKATMTKLLPGQILGFPPAHYLGVGKRYTRHPSGKKATPAGATASVPRRQGFLQTTQKPRVDDA